MGRKRIYASDRERSAAYNEAHRASGGVQPMKSLPMALGIKGMVKPRKKFASGGMVKDGEVDNSPVSIADDIRRKQKAAENDTVDLEMNDSEDSPFDFDDMNELAGMDDLYDVDDELSDQPLDSKGQEMDDEHDLSLVDKIRRKYKK